MNLACASNTEMNSVNVQETYVVLGVLLQFLSTPEQIGNDISVMRGTIPSGVVVPLHRHPDPEIFYVMEGSFEVFQADDLSRGWKTLNAGDTVVIPGSVHHALRNTTSGPMVSLAVTTGNLYRFFRELAQPLKTAELGVGPSTELMQKVFEVAVKYHYWLASPEENAAIGISLPEPKKPQNPRSSII